MATKNRRPGTATRTRGGAANGGLATAAHAARLPTLKIDRSDPGYQRAMAAWNAVKKFDRVLGADALASIRSYGDLPNFSALPAEAKRRMIEAVNPGATNTT